MPTENNKIFLSRANLKGFKSIKDLSVDLKPGLNILIGKNASGKSNFLECLFQSMAYVNPNLTYRFKKLEFVSDETRIEWEAEREMSILGEKKENIEERVRFKEKLFVDKKEIYRSDKDIHSLSFGKRRISVFGGARPIMRRIGFSITPLYIRYNLPSKDLECIDASGNIKVPLNKEEIGLFWSDFKTLNFLIDIFLNAELSYDGNLDKIKKITKLSFLRKLKINNDIITNLRKYTPIQDVKFNENLNLYKTDQLLTIENLKLDFKLNNEWIPWSHLSDGTKRLFYLVAEITNLDSGIVLVEEPELGIHPHQFHLIMEFLKEESEKKQIIISTHSPQTLNYLDENELSHILITYYDQKKGTQLKHMTTSQVSKAKKYMKEVGFLSDYWMLSDLEA